MFNIFAVFLFTSSILQISFNIYRTIITKNLVDFLVYKQAVDSFFKGKDVYQHLYSLPLNKIPFNYPPSALVILAFFHLANKTAGAVLITILSLFSLIFGFYLIKKLAKIKISCAYLLIISSFFFQTFPTKFTLILGQINLIVLGLFISSLYLYFRYKKNKNLYLFSALLFSLSSGLKIFPLYSLPLFLFLKDFLYPLLVIAFFLILNFVPGLKLFTEYFQKIVPQLINSQNMSLYNQSAIAFLLRLSLPLETAKIISLLIFVLLLSWIFILFYKERNKFEKAPFYFYLIILVASFNNSFSWQHHLVFAFPAIFYWYLKDFSKKISLKSLVLFGSLWLIFTFHFISEKNIPFQNPFFASYQTIALTVLTLYLIGKKAVNLQK